jgi:hypothetical protein
MHRFSIIQATDRPDFRAARQNGTPSNHHKSFSLAEAVFKRRFQAVEKSRRDGANITAVGDIARYCFSSA